MLLCTGWKFERAIFAAEALPQMSASATHQPRSRSKKYPELTHAYEAPNVHGMYFAGTLTHGKDWRKAAGGFIHGFRYTTQALHRILEHRMHQVEWPHRSIALQEQDGHGGEPLDRECSAGGALLELLQTVRHRVNEASALYQMFGQLWDVIVFDPGTCARATHQCSTAQRDVRQRVPGFSSNPVGARSDDMTSAKYYYEVPSDYIHRELITSPHLFSISISFDYGPTEAECPDNTDGRMCASHSARDIFRSKRTPFSNPGWLGVSEFLHPVFKFRYPARARPTELHPGTPFTAKHIGSWPDGGVDLFMDPHFYGFQGGASKRVFDSWPDSYDQLARSSPMEVLEYHLCEDFNLDWTPWSKWSGFYEFLKHGVRDVFHARGGGGEPAGGKKMGSAPVWAEYTSDVTFGGETVGWWAAK